MSLMRPKHKQDKQKNLEISALYLFINAVIKLFNDCCPFRIATITETDGLEI